MCARCSSLLGTREDARRRAADSERPLRHPFCLASPCVAGRSAHYSTTHTPHVAHVPSYTPCANALALHMCFHMCFPGGLLLLAPDTPTLFVCSASTSALALCTTRVALSLRLEESLSELPSPTHSLHSHSPLDPVHILQYSKIYRRLTNFGNIGSNFT